MKKALCYQEQVPVLSGGLYASTPIVGLNKLSIVNGPGLLNFSHSPHYNSEPARKPLYLKAIEEGKLHAGYACDDMAGFLFLKGPLKRSVSFSKEDYSYFIILENRKVMEELLPSEIIK